MVSFDPLGPSGFQAPLWVHRGEPTHIIKEQELASSSILACKIGAVLELKPSQRKLWMNPEADFSFRLLPDAGAKAVSNCSGQCAKNIRAGR